jgi:glycosyltransferase involved in cell wall biosynthesis
MNILEIVSGGDINGAVVHCLLLSREFARRGHSVTLLCRHNAQIARMAAADPIEIIESDLRRWPLDELRHIARLSHERQIDIIHTHMTRAHNFGVFLRRFSGIPCVATAHTHIAQPHWMFADHVIAVSDATRRFHRRRSLVRAARIETVHGFMDYERIVGVAPNARQKVRAELGIAESTPLLGMIGDIIPRKGQIYLVRALPRILAACPEARLLVVGAPKRGVEYSLRVKAEAERLGVDSRIVWVGQRSDVPDMLAALDIYVMASLDEMFPVAALEAMAAQLPMVVTEVGGIPECAQPEQTALLVPEADPGALAEAILRLLGDTTLRQTLAANARRVAREQFSLHSQAPRIEAVFERVRDRSRPTRQSKPDARPAEPVK